MMGRSTVSEATSEVITPDQARAAIAQEQQHRIALFDAELRALQEKHRCVIVGVPVMTPLPGGTWGIRVEIQARPVE